MFRLLRRQIEFVPAARVLIALVVAAAAQSFGALHTLAYPRGAICTHFFSTALALWPAVHIARRAAVRFPSPKMGRWRWLIGHVLHFAIFDVFVAVASRSLRELAQSAFGVAMPGATLASDILRGVPAFSVMYLISVSVSLAAQTAQRLQHAERVALDLQGKVLEAQLEQVRSSLDPEHALRSMRHARALVTSDWRAAERELLQLADALRAGRTTQPNERAKAALGMAGDFSMALDEDVPLFSIRLKPALATLGMFVAMAALQASALVASGDRPMTYALLATGALTGWLMLPVPVLATRAARRLWAARRWFALAWLHAAAYCVFSWSGVVIAQLLQGLAGWLLGQSLRAPTSYLHDWLLGLQGAVVVYALLVALCILFGNARRERLRVARASRLSAQLSQARLAALDARVDPHFLFNALNTVVAILPDDTAGSERLLEALESLLEAALDAQGPTWELAEEMRQTEHFLALLRTRFGERIQVTCDFASSSEPAQVPRFALQALVENAVKHNQRPTRPLRIEVYARAEGSRCTMVVRDDGVGFPDTPAHRPDGALTRLAEMLRLLHGQHATLRCGRGPGGGAEVTVHIPLQGSS